jgi:hypothetical protein
VESLNSGATAAAGQPAPKIVWSLVLACLNNRPGTGNNDTCGHALFGCPPGDMRWRAYFTDAARTPPDFWHFNGEYCLGPMPTIDLAAVRREVDRIFHQDLPLPAGTVQSRPPGGTLVNLPTLFATSTGTGPISFQVTALGLRVALTATPTAYRWDFGDGQTLTTYTAGDLTARDTTHTYRQPATGSPVRVSIDWAGHYRIAGISRTFTVTGQVTTTSPATPVPVREARDQLVAGDQ